MAPNPATVVGEDVLVKAHEGDTQVVTAWLDEGGGVDARCAEQGSTTLLMAAASGGHEAMVRMLLQRGAGVNLQSPGGRTALMGAAANGLTTIVQALLDAKADASLRGIDGTTALMYAEHQNHPATAQLLRQHAKRQTAEAEARAAASLVHAAAAADAMAAKLLGEEAAEKEAAAKTGKGSKKKKKKKAKAVPSAVTAEPAAAAPLAGAPKPAAVKEGLPAGVSDAAHGGDAQAVTAWLDEGGGVDARCALEGSVTLLMAAACGGQEAMVRMLLQRGASVNLDASVGDTALMHATVNGHTTIVQALLDAKADAGITALILAEQRKQTATAQLLRQHAKRQTAEAEARAAASLVHAAAAADAMAAELLGEEAAEKEAAANKGKGKKKKARAPSTAAAESTAAAPLAGPPEPAAAQEKLPDEPSS
jgi:ankyrin repeat protein